MFSKVRFCLDQLTSDEKKELKHAIDKEDGLCQDYVDEDVSYLVTNKMGSKNFYVAQDLNIPIIPPKMVYDSISAHVVQNPSDYTFKLFEGIVATTTGFDLHERYAMQSLVELHGGIFERELVYDRTTYLIARNIQSEKYRTAVEWSNIIIVNEDWLTDSTTRGKLQDPVHYQNYTQTVGSARQDKAASAPQPTSFTDSCLSMIQPLDDSYLTPNKTIAHTREVDKLLDGFIFYLSIENDKCYKRIQAILTCHGAFCIDHLLPSTTLIIAETLTDYQNVIQALHSSEALNSPSSSISSFSGFENAANQEPDLFSIPILNTNWVLETHSSYRIQNYDDYQWTKGIFSNLSFYIYEFKRDYESVERNILTNDGKVVPSMDAATYIICPRTVDSDIYLDDRAVSVMWLRDCINSKRLVSRASMVLYRPLPRLLDNKVLCLTGFGHDDNVIMEKYVVALGGKLENKVSSSLYALVCKERVKMNVKIKEAIRLNIPRVRRDWIDHLIVHKEFVPLEDYLIEEESSEKEKKDNQEIILDSEVVQIESKAVDSVLPSQSTMPAPALSSMYTVDCRSNSLAGEGKHTDETSLFGEKKDKEVIYTSFNEIFKNSSGTSTSQKSLLNEEQIQKESQNILSPRPDKPKPSGEKSLLTLLPKTVGGNIWGNSLMSKSSKRIRLDEEDTESKRTSITVLEEDDPDEEKPKGRQPKEKTTKAVATRKSTRTRKK